MRKRKLDDTQEKLLASYKKLKQSKVRSTFDNLFGRYGQKICVEYSLLNILNLQIFFRNLSKKPEEVARIAMIGRNCWKSWRV